MARDFTIYNNDVRSKSVFYGKTYAPYSGVYAPYLSGFMPVVGNYETIYGPLSFQIAGPISLRGVSEPYQLLIGEKD